MKRVPERPLHHVQKVVGLVAAVLTFGLILTTSRVSQAGSLSNIGFALTDTSVNANTTFTVTFIPSSKIPAAGGRIRIRLWSPLNPGYSSAAVNVYPATLDTGLSPAGLSADGGGSNTISIQTSTDIQAETPVTVRFKGRSLAYPGNLWAQVWTTSNGYEVLDGSSSQSAPSSISAPVIIGAPNVTGKITDGSGNPTYGASVQFVPDGASPGPQAYYSTVTKDGGFAIGSVPPGKYQARYFHSSYNNAKEMVEEVKVVSGSNHFDLNFGAKTVGVGGTPPMSLPTSTTITTTTVGVGTTASGTGTATTSQESIGTTEEAATGNESGSTGSSGQTGTVGVGTTVSTVTSKKSTEGTTIGQTSSGTSSNAASVSTQKGTTSNEQGLDAPTATVIPVNENNGDEQLTQSSSVSSGQVMRESQSKSQNSIRNIVSVPITFLQSVFETAQAGAVKIVRNITQSFNNWLGF